MPACLSPPLLLLLLVLPPPLLVDTGRFKLGLLMAAKTDMAQYLDVFHAVYRPVVEVSE